MTVILGNNEFFIRLKYQIQPDVFMKKVVF